MNRKNPFINVIITIHSYCIDTFNYFLSECIDFLFPMECLGCGCEGAYLCNLCISNVQGHPELCPICHVYTFGSQVCNRCKKMGVSYQGIVVCFYFEGIIKQAILGLKYGHYYSLTLELATKLSLQLQCHTLLSQIIDRHSEGCAITYIPSHWTRKYFQKGYNQSQLLAKQVAKNLYIRYIDVVTKHRRTIRQTGLSRRQRIFNLRSAFYLQGEIDPCIHTIIIVDDVVSTGSSIHAIGQCIKDRYPDVNIWGLCIARN